MATTTDFSLTSFMALASYATEYAEAAAGGGAVVSEWPWIGQYHATNPSQFEINQVMVEFDTASAIGDFVSAALAVTVEASYDSTLLEAREHDWTPDASAFVPGIALGSKRLLGSVAVGPGGQREITIALSQFDLTRPLKIVLAIADQRLGVAPTGDTTLLATDARLVVTTAPPRRPLRSFRWL